jgi:hypothetical protein
MRFSRLFRLHTVDISPLKKTHLAFTLVLVGCLLFSIIPAVYGFIALEHQDFPELDTLIKKVHDKHWIIHYSYADNCPPEARNNGAVLTAAMSKALRTWLQPLRDYTKKPIVDDFRYQLSADWNAADLGVIFHCHIGSSTVLVSVGETPGINMRHGTHVKWTFMESLVHEMGHVFGLQDTYLLHRDKGKGLDTGGLDRTRGAQPASVMSLNIPLFTLERARADAELHGLFPLGVDDINGIVWFYKHIYEGQPLKDCFFPDYEFEEFPVGCCPKYPLIFELKYGSTLNNAKEKYALRIIEEDEGLDVNPQDADGMTALHYAVMQESTKVVRQLLAHKDIIPYLRNKQGHSALQIARENKLDFMIKLLLRHPLTLPVNPKGKLAMTWGHLKKQY